MTAPCSCEKCRELCLGRPGIFAPAQILPAAAELGLTLAEFFAKYITINWWADRDSQDPDHEWDHVSPGWDHGVDSAILSYRFTDTGTTNVGRRCTFAEGFTGGKCALLTPTGCALSFERRPEECQRAYGCDKRSNEPAMAIHRDVAVKWLEPDGLAILEQLGAVGAVGAVASGR